MHCNDCLQQLLELHGQKQAHLHNKDVSYAMLSQNKCVAVWRALFMLFKPYTFCLYKKVLLKSLGLERTILRHPLNEISEIFNENILCYSVVMKEIHEMGFEYII